MNGSDAGERDGGPRTDAAAPADAGTTDDAGSADSGAADAGSSDAGSSDAGSSDAGATNDGGATQPDSGVVTCDFVGSLSRECTADDDCIVVIHQTDCCGNTAAIGLNRAESAEFDADEPLCRATYPRCGCPARPTVTDSGETADDTSAIQVACIDTGPTNTCLTYVTTPPAP